MVDEDEVFRRSTARTLTARGYSCIEAAGALEARAALDAGQDVAAVLCAADVLREINADFPDLAVVVIAGVDDPRVDDAEFETAAFGYIVKPFDANELIVALANALRRRELEAMARDTVRALEQTIRRTRTLGGVVRGIGGAIGTQIARTEDTIERLSLALSLRGEETRGHLERMSRYSAALAEAVGLSGLAGLSNDDVRLAATLHDVGKIGVPDGIRTKPGPLSRDEYAAMQRHAQMGYQLLAGSVSPLVRVAADIALCHHEWWDGGGYPRGLTAAEIPEAGRIAAVADVFDALTSNRVYRAARPVDEAVGIMSERRGRQFEPRLFDAFVESIDTLESIRVAFADDAEAGHRIRVLVVDDHDSFARSLVRLLGTQTSLRVVGTAGTVADAVAGALADEPDVVLMDFKLPDGDGSTATEQIKALLPTVKVVMLTAYADDHAMVRAIAAGCSGFVNKQDPFDVLVGAIVAAHEGETITPPTDLAPLLRQLRPTHRRLGADLTPRELEVIQLVAGGLGNKEIAQRLHVTLNTVRNHVQNTFYKLQAHSKLEAVATAVREGVIDYPATERRDAGGTDET